LGICIHCHYGEYQTYSYTITVKQSAPQLSQSNEAGRCRKLVPSIAAFCIFPVWKALRQHNQRVTETPIAMTVQRFSSRKSSRLGAFFFHVLASTSPDTRISVVVDPIRHLLKKRHRSPPLAPLPKDGIFMILRRLQELMPLT
jgi:hypothetical protein